MSSYMKLPPSVREVILWVPEDVFGHWYNADPEGASMVATEAANRLGGAASIPEDEITVARLVLSGGDEVDLLRLAASGLIANKEAFQRAATWVKRRRTFPAIINLSEAHAVRQSLVDGLGPLGWDSPDVARQAGVVVAIRTFENALMTWCAITKAAPAEAMRKYIKEVTTTMGLVAGVPMSAK